MEKDSSHVVQVYCDAKEEEDEGKRDGQRLSWGDVPGFAEMISGTGERRTSTLR